MESKKLSFNMKMVGRDVLRNWPVWALATLGYLLCITGFYSLFSYSGSTEESIAGDIISLMMGVTEFASIGLGFVAALVAFGYLGSKRKHYMYEVLPMNRTGMFFTRFLLGFIVMSIPSVIIYVVEIIQVSAKTGHFLIGPLSAWLLINTAQNLFWLAFGTLFMVICGRKLMAGILYAAFSVVGLAFEYTLAIFNSIMFIGYGSSLSDADVFHIGILSPIEYMFTCGMGIRQREYVGLEGYFGVINLLTVFIAAIVLIVLGFILYKKRRAERTDDNIVFNGAKTVCAVIFTVVFAVEGLLVLLGLFIYRSEGISHFAGIRMVIVLLIICLSIAGYLIACMIIEKKLKVFKKKYLVKACIISAVLTLFTVLYIHDVFGIEKKVPETEELAAAWVSGQQIVAKTAHNYNYEDTYSTEEELKAITGLHQIIVDNMDELIEVYDSIDWSIYIRDTSDYSNYDVYHQKVYPVDSCRIYIDYILKNGRDYYKNYYIKPEGPLFEKIKAYVNQYPDIFQKGKMNGSYYFD